MKNTRLKSVLSLIACAVLIAAMALCTGGCADNQTEPPDTKVTESTTAASGGEQTVLGEGAHDFCFTVTDAEGKETAYQIRTDKETVGEALQELDLIAGEESTYGLYVKTVNGITLDYDTDGKYWAFYVNGAYASSGADTAAITDGATYSFKAEK